jgi:hypothetical protein
LRTNIPKDPPLHRFTVTRMASEFFLSFPSKSGILS